MAWKDRSNREGTHMAKTAPKIKPRTKSQILNDLADATGLTKKQVASVFEAMSDVIKKDLSKRGPGVFTIPGLLKIRVQDKPATKERPGINPFTKEPMIIKAKPARRVVKATALKALKEMV
jgi:nucleoid DNA-binding protein